MTGPMFDQSSEVPTIEEAVRELILSALDIYRGNRTHTAYALGISLRCLRYRLQKYESEGHAVAPVNGRRTRL